MSLSASSSARKFVGALLPADVKKHIGAIPDYLDVVKFSFPNVVKPRVAISAEAGNWLRELREFGIVRIENDVTCRAADYLESSYFAKLERASSHDLDGGNFDDRRLFTRSYNIQKYQSYGTKVGCYISFKDTALATILLSPDIAGVLYNYYRRQPYYRNQPVIEFIDTKPNMTIPKGNEYHVDNFHQISGMLLVTDQNEKTTHMEYLPRSHKRSLLQTGVMMSDETCAQWAAESRDRLYRLIGRKGTLYVFDTTGVHRRNLIPGSSRKILHFTITTGHHLGPHYDTVSDWPELNRTPEHVQRMFERLPTAAA